MASDLASQLQSLAAKAGVEQRRPKGQPSLLHDSKTASDIGVDDIYDKAVEGAEFWHRVYLRELDFLVVFGVEQAQCLPHHHATSGESARHILHGDC